MREYKGFMGGRPVTVKTSSQVDESEYPKEMTELNWVQAQRIRTLELQRYAQDNKTVCDHCHGVKCRDDALEMYLGKSNLIVACLDCLRKETLSLTLTPKGIQFRYAEDYDENRTIKSTKDLFPSSLRPE